MASPFPFRFHTCRDGTRLSYFRRGESGGPALVLCNGLGAGASFWQPLAEHFVDRFDVLGWDYRGLYGSGPADDYAVLRHAEDLHELLEAEGIGRATVLGWSMGAQVMLEAYRVEPERWSSLVFLNGTYGRLIQTALSSPLVAAFGPRLLSTLQEAGPGAGQIGRLAKSSPRAMRAFADTCIRLGALAPELHLPSFLQLLDGWLSNDLRVYAAMLRDLDAHDGSGVLADVHVPALVVSGGLDVLTPSHLSEDITASLPQARHVHLERASHFALLECPDAVYRALDDFFAVHRF